MSSDGCIDGKRSPEELRAFIESMSPEEKRRLLAAAVVLARTAYCGDPEDLMQEAFAAAMSGTRKCPVDVHPLKFLSMAMKSILSNERDRMARVDLVDMQDEDNQHLAGSCESPVDLLERVERIKDLARTVTAHFGDDDRPMMIFEGRAEGLSRAEIREILEMDQVEFESLERRLRRFMNKEFPGRNS